MEQSLVTVHEALAQASTEAPVDKPMETYTIRCHKESVHRAKEICEAHGTTLSEYLRKCMELLPRDYQP